MIDRNHDLSIVRQAKVLNLARSTVYYKPRPVSAEDLALMRRLDELHLDYPFAGARMLRSLLRRAGLFVGRRRVATLMKRMGIEAIYCRPNTSKPAPGHKIYPYLLRGMRIERPDHVWATLGADKGYDAEAFVEGLKARGIEPHVAINGTVSKTGKARKTVVPSEVAASVPPGLQTRGQRLRKRIEEGFGWTKTVGGLMQVKVRSLAKVRAVFVFAIAAYNIVRLPKLLAPKGEVRPAT